MKRRVTVHTERAIETDDEFEGWLTGLSIVCHMSPYQLDQLRTRDSLTIDNLGAVTVYTIEKVN